MYACLIKMETISTVSQMKPIATKRKSSTETSTDKTEKIVKKRIVNNSPYKEIGQVVIHQDILTSMISIQPSEGMVTLTFKIFPNIKIACNDCNVIKTQILDEIKKIKRVQISKKKAADKVVDIVEKSTQIQTDSESDSDSD
jgi:hypothetical protein